jgi:hypothetical protein
VIEVHPPTVVAGVGRCPADARGATPLR